MVIKCRDRILDLTHPAIMGIVNLTPDSFYDGGKWTNEKQVLAHVDKIILEGASIIDIGGMSSRPGAELIGSQEELKRIYTLTKKIRNLYPDVFISIDTIYADTAETMLDIGVDIINDISAWAIDPRLIEVVASYGAAYVLMHMKGKPQSMQTNPAYEDVIKEIITFFIAKIEQLEKNNVKDIIIDPGFGFGKSIDQNFAVLKKLSVFRILEKPILAGISRKSMFYKLLDIDPAQALPATSIGNYIGLCQGAKILRVHDVKEAAHVIKIFQKCSI